VTFATRGWLEAVAAALNRQPDLPKALAGLGRDAGLVVERDAGFARDVAAWGRQEKGRVAEVRLLPDPDDLLELEPAYVVRAPYRLWKELIAGRLDPVKAALSGRVRVQGDLDALVRRAGYRYVVEAALREVATVYPDDGGAG
jgi:hypothetical protein